MTTPKMQPANAHEAPKKESSHNADPYNGNEEVDEDDLMDGSTTDPSTEPPPSDPDTPATDEEAVSNTETDSTTPLTSPETESPDEEVFSPIPDSSTTSEDEQLSEQLRNNGTNGTTVENGVDGLYFFLAALVSASGSDIVRGGSASNSSTSEKNAANYTNSEVLPPGPVKAPSSDSDVPQNAMHAVVGHKAPPAETPALVHLNGSVEQPLAIAPPPNEGGDSKVQVNASQLNNNGGNSSDNGGPSPILSQLPSNISQPNATNETDVGDKNGTAKTNGPKDDPNSSLATTLAFISICLSFFLHL
ncbi:hypothetical protein Aduo_011309 [Ancylostoma duodenale]